MPRSKCFGSDLTKNRIPGDAIPCPLREITSWMVKYAVPATPDIFEHNKKSSVVKSLIETLEANPLAKNFIKTTIRDKDVATLLLLYLRSLPYALIPTRFYATLIKISKIDSQKARAYEINCILQCIPRERKESLIAVATYLKRSCLPASSLEKTFKSIFFRPLHGSHHPNASIIVKDIIANSLFFAGKVSEPISFQTEDGNEEKRIIQANIIEDFSDSSSDALAVKKGDVVTLINAFQDDCLIVKNSSGKEGYVPVSCLEPVLVDFKEIESEIPASSRPSKEHKKAKSYCNLDELQLPPPPEDFDDSEDFAALPPPLPATSSDLGPPSSPPLSPPPPCNSDNLAPPPFELAPPPLPERTSKLSKETLIPPPLPPSNDLPPPFVPPSDKAPPPFIPSDTAPPPPLRSSCQQLNKHKSKKNDLNRRNKTLSRPLKMQTKTSSQVLNSLDIPPPPPPKANNDDWKLKLNPNDAQKLPELLKKRFYIFQELVSTEVSYLKSLELLNTNYYVPLKSDSKGLSEEDVYGMFSNLDFLISFHRSFLDSLQKALAAWSDNSCVGDMLLCICPKLKLYHHYVVNHDNALRIFTKGQEVKAFKKFVDGLDYSAALGGLCFESLLICPIQRVPRYVLLIQDLLKHTPSVHPDFISLSKSYDLLHDLAGLLNAEKRKNEILEKLRHIQEKIEGFVGDLTAFETSRDFVNETDCKINKDKMHAFFFTDIVVLTKKSGSRFQYKRTVNLFQAIVTTEKEFVVVKLCDATVLKIHCEDENDRDFWVKAIKSSGEAASSLDSEFSSS